MYRKFWNGVYIAIKIIGLWPIILAVVSLGFMIYFIVTGSFLWIPAAVCTVVFGLITYYSFVGK